MGMRLKKPCLYDSCNNVASTKGLCKAHYMQSLRGEKLHDLPVIPEKCQYEGCGRKHSAKGLCKGHYYQVYNGKELSPLRQDVAKYSAIHQRLRDKYGPAVNYQCVQCGGQAAEWAFVGDPAIAIAKTVVNRRGKETVNYFSRDLTQYKPMCHSCHVKYDMAVKSRGWQPWACA